MSLDYDLIFDQGIFIVQLTILIIVILAYAPKLFYILIIPLYIIYVPLKWVYDLLNTPFERKRQRERNKQYQKESKNKLELELKEVKSKVQCIPSYPLAIDINVLLLNELRIHSKFTVENLTITSIDDKSLTISICASEINKHDQLIQNIHKSLCAFFIPLYKPFVFEYQIIEYNTGVHPVCISSIIETKYLSYD